MLKFRTFLFLKEEEEEHYPFHYNGKEVSKHGFVAHQYHFKANKGHYAVTFAHHNEAGGDKHTDLSFSHLQPQRKSWTGRKLRGNRRVSHEMDVNHSAGLDARKIFHTVHAVAKHHISKHPEIESVGFSGSGQSRVKAYDTMLKHKGYKAEPGEFNNKYEKDWSVKVR